MTLPRYIRRVVWLLVFASAILGAHIASAEEPTLERREKASILSALFSMSLNDPQQLQRALPQSWLLPHADLSSARKAAEAQLLALRTKEKLSPGEQEELDLLVLQIQWLKLSPEARAKYITEVQARQVASSSEQKGSQLIEESKQEVEAARVSEQAIAQQVSTSVDEREAFLLNTSLSLEQKKLKLAQAKKRLGEFQQELANQVSDWKSLEAEIFKAVEAQNEGFIRFRPILRTRLKESNRRVKSRAAFEQYALSDIATLNLQTNLDNVVARSSDTEDMKHLVQAIHESAINLNTSTELLIRERSALFLKRLQWEKNYRAELLNSRGSIINRLKRAEAMAEGGEPLLQEGRTVVSSIAFALWSFKPLYIDYREAHDKTITDKLSEYAHLLRLLALTVFAGFLLVKKNAVVSYVKKLIQKLLINTRAFWRQWTSELFSNLYVFLVLLLLGNLVIEFGVGLGFSFLAGFTPIFNTVLYFFLGWGCVDFIQPFISQRRFQRNSTLMEIEAMEGIFAFVPKLLLLYYLTASLTEHIAQLWLQENFISSYLQLIYQFVFFLALFVGVWWKRHWWRMVAAKAVKSPRLDQFIVSAQNKVWEPLVLLLAGGLGVYLLTWRILKNRIGELEFARSFQAMFSRALLERRRRNSTVRVSFERFPEGYLNAFNHETRALPNWHVVRKEALIELDSAYERWQTNKQGTTVLITGDRGVGKSELIYQFLRTHNIAAKECKLRPGDTELAQVIETMSKSFCLPNFAEDPEAFVRALWDMEPSVIVLENLENCILRQVDGFDSFTFVVDLIMAMSGRHLWLVTFTTYAWTIAKRAVPGADCFAQYIYLRGMNEEEIKQMVVQRHQSHPSSRLDFSNLALEDMSKRRRKHPTSLQEEEERRQNLFFRILWDYTGGNPRQALYFWKTAVGFEGDRANVSLFDIPEQAVLENLRDKSLMLLAALVEHNGLTVEGLSSVLNEPKATVRRWVEEVTPYGIVYSFGDPDSGHYGWHVESFWISIVEDYLEKRKLLFRGGLR